ncbi:MULTISPECIES: four-helix bundle copper-binding protein [Nocardia]|uniref:four-helix bundle copper-binding protein n=1 Tax=Nocardia TaxID=1817 RepID=UPI000CE9E42F|nr:four-helix bundle copper-binding protein [Nocardia nova]PPJ03997.1 four-helix bundle copper-binding protein [Nocardia nova]
MTTVLDMFGAHPGGPGKSGALTADEVARCVEECVACQTACTICADSCLAEPDVAALRQCIREDLDCADICGATARVLARRTAFVPFVAAALVRACAAACASCAEECASHTGMTHCEQCAQACHRCERACQDVLEKLLPQ